MYSARSANASNLQLEQCLFGEIRATPLIKEEAPQPLAEGRDRVVRCSSTANLQCTPETAFLAHSSCDVNQQAN